MKNEQGTTKRKGRTKHGMRYTRFYKIWDNMKSRCTNDKSTNYPRYGAKGITICDRWMEFTNFYDDMYISYKTHVSIYGEANTSLDRINPFGNYKPSNCRWATNKVQAANKKDNPYVIPEGIMFDESSSEWVAWYRGHFCGHDKDFNMAEEGIRQAPHVWPDK